MERTREMTQTIAVLSGGVGVVAVSKESRMLLSLFQKLDTVEQLNCLSVLYNQVDRKQTAEEVQDDGTANQK